MGCRDRSTTQDANDKVCEEVAKLDGSVTQLASLTPSAASAAQVGRLRSEMEAQYRRVQEAAEDSRSFKIDSITQAYNNVLRSINGVNSEAALAQAEPQIDQAAGDFSTARAELHTQAAC